MHWMENIRDWCISRQLWWGHRIPVWYCDNGAHVRRRRRARRSARSAARRSWSRTRTCSTPGSRPGSGRSPRSAGRRRRATCSYFYPTTVLETGYDILFFWVARMIMLGLYDMGDVPFRHVYLHGLIRDAKGRKMTKSRGNVVDPLELTEKYGTDALRFTLATGGTPGNDFRLFDEKLESVPQLRQQALERRPLRRLRASATRRSRCPTIGARVRTRGLAAGRPLDRLAHAGHGAGGEQAARRLPDQRGRPRPLRLHLERVLRLVPGDGQGAPEGRRPLAAAGPGLRPPVRPAPPAPDHAVRHRGDLAAPARPRRRPRAGGADHRAVPARRRRAGRRGRGADRRS